MAKLGKINFSDFSYESDSECNINYIDSENLKNFDKNSCDSFEINNNKYNKVLCSSLTSESSSDLDSDSESCFTYKSNKSNKCNPEIITYDNTENKSNKNNSQKNNCRTSNCNGIENRYEISEESENFTPITHIKKDINLPKTNNKCNSIKGNSEKTVRVFENKICNFDQMDIVAKKLFKIVESFKTISHLVQYYLRMLEQVKIDVSQSDISHAVNSCIETTVSLASYLKADIDRNKTFVVDDKYNNREGYYLTNGLTKIYYIEKIKLSLYKNGELSFAVYEDKKNIKNYELGNDYANANYEGDLYTMIDIAKEKATNFNMYIQRKHMKVSSIFNLHLIYLNKYK